MGVTLKNNTEEWLKILKARDMYTVLRDFKDLSRADFDVLTLVGARPEITIQEILRDDLFGRTELSSVKRSVIKLKALKLIESAQGADGRERHLTIVTEEHS
ncbi:MAG: MarR family transcriptional regulator [Candidatus Marinimicrobia bacterium]|jgi:DNA-binding MarR family transcriptional regulator|nr:MarR family transcriptional regulator [Candidatus Neomarinimicrobiota bacterium]